MLKLMLPALLLALVVACGAAAPTAGTIAIPPWEPPTPFPSPAPVPSIEDDSHPNGLEGCRSVNQFAGMYDHLFYDEWCRQALQDDVREHCSGIGTPTQERDCADNRLEDVQNYYMRVWLVPCVAISGVREQQRCKDESEAAYKAHRSAFISTWDTVLRAVTDDPQVRARFQLVGECVKGLGFEAPDASVPLPWHQIDPISFSTALVPPGEPAARDAENQRRSAINHCALAVGLYEVQDAKWRSKIKRLSGSERKPLENEAVIDSLEEPGPAPFLVAQKRFLIDE